MKKIGRVRLRYMLLASLVFLFAWSLLAAHSSRAQDGERRIWDSEFLKKRAAAKAPSTMRKATAYRRATPKNVAIDEKATGEMMGVTVWRLRESSTTDNKETRLLLQDEEKRAKTEFTPERVEAETPFAEGERVRLGIESPRDGFLYVIDRELYADGTTSDPYLIFPTLRNREGDNAVNAGKLIEIPNGSAFRLKATGQDKSYRGEVLTVLVTSAKLTAITVGPSMVKLDRKQVEQWEKQWNAPIERFELVGGAGKTYTKAEKEAGADGSRLLTQEDDLPQTLYRVIAKPGNPLLVSVPLKIGK
jgi:hypothetical protein